MTWWPCFYQVSPSKLSWGLRHSECLILDDPVPGDFSLVDQRQKTVVAFKGMFLARWPIERNCSL